MIKNIFYGLLCITLLSSACTRTQNQPTTQTQLVSDYATHITVARHELFVAVANTDAARTLGLSKRAAMAQNQGMLFDLGNTSSIKPGFWMKDMRFPLDMIWIKNKTIIGITKNIPPAQKSEKSPHIYYPPKAVDTVLEVNAGWSENNSVKVGEKLNY